MAAGFTSSACNFTGRGGCRIVSQKWDNLPAELHYAEPYDELLAREYSWIYAELINRWAPPSGQRMILKTDLYDEALCKLRSFAAKVTSADDCVVGMDISKEITGIAKLSESTAAQFRHFTCCDVRFLPFPENVFDLIISDSTLDHFKIKDDIRRSLAELYRVLKPGGILVLSLDNSSNLTEPLFRAWIALGLAPFYIGPTLSRRELYVALRDTGFTVTDETAIVHIPRFFGKLAVKLLRLLCGKKLDPDIAGCLRRLNSLEHMRTRYLTAQFIAVRAVKNRR